MKPCLKLVLSTGRLQVWNCERTLGNKFDCIYRTINRSYLTQLSCSPLELKKVSFCENFPCYTFFVTSIMANETSLFVCVKDSPVSDRWSDSLSVAAFDWASLLLQSFPFRPVSKRTHQFLSKVLGVLIVLWGYGHEYLDLSWLGLGPGKTKKNLGFFSNFNQNTVMWFQASFRRVLGVLVTWRCFMNCLWLLGVFSDFKKLTKHNQIASTPEF